MEHILKNPISLTILLVFGTGSIMLITWWFFRVLKLRVKGKGVDIEEIKKDTELFEEKRSQAGIEAGVHRGCENYCDVELRVSSAVDKAIMGTNWFHDNARNAKHDMWQEIFDIMDDSRQILMEKFFINNCKEILKKKNGLIDVSQHSDLSKYIAYFGTEMEKGISNRTRGKLKRARLLDIDKLSQREIDGWIASVIEEFYVASMRLEDTKMPFAKIETFNRADIQEVEDKNKHYFEEVSRSFFNEVISVARTYKAKLDNIDTEYRRMIGLI